MGREADLSTVESEFLLTCLQEGQRLDGRGPFDCRPVSLFPSENDALVECCLGETRVAAHVSAEIVRPRADRPFEGFLQVSAEISPMASFAFEYGRTSGAENLIARMLEKTLRRSGAVDQEALCILAGQKVWSIRVDLHFLNDEGNLLDCASIAAIAALRHFRKPDVTLVGEEVILHTLEERIPVPLALHHSPLCITFAFFGSTSSLVTLDPSRAEEQLAGGTLTVTLNAQREICVFNKAGGVPLEVHDVMRVVTAGVKRAQEVDELITQSLKKAEMARKELAAIQSR